MNSSIICSFVKLCRRNGKFVKKSIRKVGLNKVSIKDGLSVFFEGDDYQAESVLKVILESLPSKETSTISITGVKSNKN
jgi:hypothetical protein